MIRIIKAEKEHVPAVLEIERAFFSPSWSEGTFLHEIDNEDAHFSVAVKNGRVIGFAVLHKAADEAELFQIAVAEGDRRRGIADMLLKDAFGYAEKNGLLSVYLEVRESNIPAKAFYKKYGFEVVGRRKNYYMQPTENAVIMSAVLDGKKDNE